MARQPLQSLRDIASEVLEEVDHTARMKTAERQIVREVASAPHTDLGQLLSKVAEAVRQSDDEVSYDDVHRFIANVSGSR